MTCRIASIGAGSAGRIWMLCADLFRVSLFRAVEIALADMAAQGLDPIRRIIDRMPAVNGLDMRASAADRRNRG